MFVWFTLHMVYDLREAVQTRNQSRYSFKKRFPSKLNFGDWCRNVFTRARALDIALMCYFTVRQNVPWRREGMFNYMKRKAKTVRVQQHRLNVKHYLLKSVGVSVINNLPDEIKQLYGFNIMTNSFKCFQLRKI